MQRHTVYLYLETALHVSGGTSTHYQERIQLYLQHLVFVTTFVQPVASRYTDYATRPVIGDVVLYLLYADPPRVLPCARGFLKSVTVFLLLSCKCTHTKKIKSRINQCFGKADKNGKPELFGILHLRCTNAYVRPFKNHEDHRFLKRFLKKNHTHTHRGVSTQVTQREVKSIIIIYLSWSWATC
jgi:hypothetical protein